ncbi:hypothetical protein [Bradyrhizobium elkanii]
MVGPAGLAHSIKFKWLAKSETTDFLDLSRCLSHSLVSVYRCPIVQRDDGLFQLGTGDDAPGPFESRNLAAAVALSAGERTPEVGGSTIHG